MRWLALVLAVTGCGLGIFVPSGADKDGGGSGGSAGGSGGAAGGGTSARDAGPGGASGGGVDAAGGGDGTLPYATERQFCIDETNRYRAMVGVPPYARSSALDDYADQGAAQDGESGDPHGHFISTNGGGLALAENEVPQWDGGPSDLMQVVRDGLAAMWSEGPGGGHYENMRSTDYTLLGCGLYVSATHGITVVQDFAP